MQINAMSKSQKQLPYCTEKNRRKRYSIRFQRNIHRGYTATVSYGLLYINKESYKVIPVQFSLYSYRTINDCIIIVYWI
jgi:hypothetical protein